MSQQTWVNDKGCTVHTVTFNDTDTEPSPFWKSMMESHNKGFKCEICGTSRESKELKCSVCSSQPRKQCRRRYVGLTCPCKTCKNFENPLGKRDPCIVCAIKH